MRIAGVKKEIAECAAVLRFVWPLALGMVNNAAMQFADRAFLSNESLLSLEAVLPASMLALAVLGFFQSVVAYSGVFAAQYLGAGDKAAAKTSYRAGVALAIVSGALAAAMLPAGAAVLEAFSRGGEVLDRELSYYGIITAGGVFMLLQMSAAAYLTACGKTRLVFAANIAGNVLNAALDPVLIFGAGPIPAFGIAGAAAATVAAQAVQWAVLAVAAARAGAGRAEERADSPRLPQLLARVVRFGVPSGLYSVLNITSFTVFVFATERVGETAAAVSNACFAVNYLLIAPMEGFALGASTLTGRALGRGDFAGANRAAMRVLFLGVSFVLVLSILAVVFHRPILSLFSPPPDAAPEFYSTGFVLFALMAAWQVFDAADVILSGALKGAGDTRFVMWWMLAVAFGFWLPLVWVAAALHNTMPALWSTMVAYVAVICAGTAIRWKLGGWKKISLIGKKQD